MPKDLMINRKVLSGLLLVLLVLAVLFFAVQRVKQRLQPIPLPAVSALAVETLSLTPATFTVRAHYVGSVAAQRLVKIPAQLGGQVVKIQHREGEWVKQGELLIRLDDRELQHELKRLRASKQRLTADQDYWAQQHQRNLTLREKKVIPKSLLDESRRMVDSLAASLAENTEAMASVKIRLSHMQIRAPFDGRIQAVTTEVGDQVVPFLKPLIELVDESSLKAVVSVPQVDLARLKTGLPVDISAASLGLKLAGHIDRIYPMLDVVTRNATFETCLSCGQGAALDGLYPGMSLDADVVLERFDAVLSIPHHALQRRGESQGVFVAVDGKARWRAVQTAEVSDGRVRIVSGLAAGEQVIVTPDPRLKDGLAVSVVAVSGGVSG